MLSVLNSHTGKHCNLIAVRMRVSSFGMEIHFYPDANEDLELIEEKLQNVAIEYKRTVFEKDNLYSLLIMHKQDDVFEISIQ